MPDYLRNGFEDEDAVALIEEIEELEAEKVSVRAASAGECAGISKKIKNKYAKAKELNIPTSSLRGWIKKRKYERKIKAIEHDIPEEEIEVYLDGAGQYSFLSPDSPVAGPREDGDTEDPDRHDDTAEQAEGEEVLTGKRGRKKS